MTNKELILIIEAFERGEPVEYRNMDRDNWSPITNKDFTNWNTSYFEFRLVPKKRTFSVRYCKATTEHDYVGNANVVTLTKLCPCCELFTFTEP